MRRPRLERHPLWMAFVLLAAFFALASTAAAQEEELKPIETVPAPDLGRPVDYLEDVEPILVEKCFACHSSVVREGRLNMEAFESLIKGGKSGAVVVPGDSANSLLVKLASRSQKPAMPPMPNNVDAAPLTPEELAILRLWIGGGALGPDNAKPETPIDWTPLPPGVNPIYAAALTPDGQFAAAGRANQIFLYHVASGATVTRLTDPALSELEIYKGTRGVAHLDLVHSLAFSPDGMLLASGGYRVVKLWRRPNLNVPVGTLSGSLEALSSVAVSADGKLVAAAGADSIVRIWERASQQLLYTLEGHTGAVTGVAFTRDGARLVSAGADGTLRLWSTAGGASLGNIEVPSPINGVAVNSAGDLLATAGADNMVRLWNAAAAEPRVVAVAPSPIGVLATSTDGKLLALGGPGNAVRLVDVQTNREIRRFEGHADVITGLSFTADAARLISSAADRTVVVWDAASGAKVIALAGNSEPATAIAPSTDGTQVISGHADGLIKIWQLDVAGPKRLTGENGAPPSVLVLSPDGKWLASAGSARGVPTVQLWDLAAGNLVRSLIGHAGPVTALAFSGDSTKVISGSADRTARVWNVADGAPMGSFTGHGAPVTAVALTSDGARAVSGAADNSLHLWNIADGASLRVLSGHTAAVTGLAITPDNVRAVSASADQTLRIWDLGTATVLRSVDHGAAITAMELSRDGSKIVTGAADNSVKLWNAADAAPLATLAGSGAAVQSVAFSAGGARVLAGAADSQLVVWETTTGKLLQILPAPQGLAAAAFGSQPGTLLVGTVDNAMSVVTLNLAQTLPAHGGAVVAVALLGNNVLTGAADGTLRLFDVAQGKDIWSVAHGAAVHSVAVRPDAQVVASAGADNSIKLWNAGNGQPIENGALQGHGGPVQSVAFNHDGTRIISGGADNKVLVWDAGGALLQSFSRHGAGVLAVATAGDIVISSSADRSVRRWEPSALRRIAGHGGAVTSVAFMPGDAELLTGSADKTARLWDVADGAQVRAVDHGEAINAVAVSPDGARFVTGGNDNAARLWNAADGNKIADLAGHTAAVQSAAFSGDGSQIVTGSADKTLRTWDGSTGAVGYTVAGHAEAVLAVGYAPDAQQIVSAGADAQVKFFDLNQPWALAGRIGPEDPSSADINAPSQIVDRVLSLDFSPDGKLLATGSGEPSRSGVVQVWDVAGGTLRMDLPEAHTDTVFGLDFSRDSKFLASCAADKFVKVWDMTTATLVRSFEGHTNHVLGVTWRADGQALASCGAQGGSVGGIPGDIKIWNFQTGEQARTIGLGKQVTAISFVGDTNEVVSACGDSNARRHRTDNGQQRYNFGGASDFLYCIDVTPDGALVAAGGQDSVLRIWNANANNESVKTFEPPAEGPAQVAQQQN